MPGSVSHEMGELPLRVDSLEKELVSLQSAVQKKEQLLLDLSERVSHCEHLAGIGVDFSQPYSAPLGSESSEISASMRRARAESGDTKDTDSMLLPTRLLGYKTSLGSDASMDFDASGSGDSPTKRRRGLSSVNRKNQHKFCTFEGCEKMAHGPTYLFCLRHGGGYRCQEPGCTRSAYSTKYCSRHGGGPRCQWEGCSKGAISNSSYCRRHGGGSRCQHPNCPEGARQGFNFCLNHGGFNPCAYPNCPGIALLTSSYCRQHNALFKGPAAPTKAE